MAVQFLLGRAGTGKTRACLAALRAAQARGPARRLILLVPEQASFQMERALALPDGLWQAEVLSFSRLAGGVLDRWIDGGQLLPASARGLALRMIVAREPDLVRHFGAAARQPGFFAALERLFGEFFAEQITPRALAGAASELSAGRAERAAALGGLFERYLEWLGPDRCDPGQRLARLRKRIPAEPSLRDALIWVDGFAGFTAEELETLVLLAGTASAMTISLLLDDPEDGSQLFAPVRETYQRLRQRLVQAGIEVGAPQCLAPRPPPRFAEAPALAWLEDGLARESASASEQAPPPDGQVRLLVCETHRAELEQAARHIRGQVLQGGVRFRDFALVTRDLEPFAPLVADVFERFEIPYFLDHRRPLVAHALVRFVATLLEVVEHDFPPAATDRLLQLELLPFARRVRERLIEQLRRNEIRGGHNWQKPRWDLLSRRQEPDDVAEARRALHAAVRPLLSLAGEESPTGRAWAVALYDALRGLRVPARLESWMRAARTAGELETAEVHRAAWDALVGVLDDLHTLTAATPLTLAELSQVLLGALGDQTIGLTPPALDQVLVGAIDRTRHPDVRTTWLLATNEGIFPSWPGDDVLLGDDDRAHLAAAGVTLPRPAEQAEQSEPLLFYVAATRPASTLIISYARFGPAGDPRQPSPLLANLASVLPGVRPEEADQAGPPTCMWEFASRFLSADQQAGDDPRLAVRYHGLRAGLTRDLAAAARIGELLRGRSFRNQTTPVRYHAEKPAADGPVWSGSISELKHYQECPFRHFLKYGLRIPERLSPSPVSMELGTLGHEVLAEVVGRAVGCDARQLTDADWLTWLDAVAAARAAQIPEEVRARRPDLAFLSGAVVGRLRETVLSLAERYRRGAFRPLHVEIPFGTPSVRPVPEGAGLPALRVDLPEGGFGLVSGFIDRIDEARDEDDRPRRLVVDYKPGVGSPRQPYLNGHLLQLLTYLLAVAQQGGSGEAVGGLLSPLYFDTDALRDAPPTEQLLGMLKPRGLFRTDAGSLLDRKVAPRHRSPVVQLAIKVDGTPDRNSDAADPREFRRYLELGRVTLAQAVSGITSGRVPVAPLVHRKTLACRYCPYKAICRFERVFGGARAAERHLPLLKDMTVEDEGAPACN